MKWTGHSALNLSSGNPQLAKSSRYFSLLPGINPWYILFQHETDTSRLHFSSVPVASTRPVAVTPTILAHYIDFCPPCTYLKNWNLERGLENMRLVGDRGVFPRAIIPLDHAGTAISIPQVHFDGMQVGVPGDWDCEEVIVDRCINGCKCLRSLESLF